MTATVRPAPVIVLPLCALRRKESMASLNLSSTDPQDRPPRLGPQSPRGERMQHLSRPTERGSRYERDCEIAKGGMGVIHRVRDVELSRWLALKELAPGALQDARVAARFYEEAQVTAQ